MTRSLCLGLLLTLLSAVAAATTPLQDALARLPHVSFPASNRVAAGALQADDVALLKRAGIGEVINLREPGETPAFDEAAAMRAAGIAYRNLPIGGPADLTRANVEAFDRLLREAGATPTLVHCASSNRVGALIALRAAWIDHQPVDAALAEGRRWGLRSLEPAVRERLQAVPATATSAH